VQKAEQEQELEIESEQYKLFLNSIKSVETKKAYPIYFKKYVEFVGNYNNLFCQNDPRLIERKIIDFIISLKDRGLTFSAVKNYVTAIMSFYKINDMMLNSKKISKFMPEQKRVKKDNAYTREQIQYMLDVADDRYRAMILVMASTGVRVGAIPELKLRNLEKLENDIYKVTVYENSSFEYVTFTTPECSKAIDKYLEIRKRYGEELHGDSPVIREQFDVKDPFSISKPSSTSTQTIHRLMTNLSIRAGLRTQEKLDGIKKPASYRKDIAVCHGFRKFFSSQLVEAEPNVKPELRWLLEGHKLKGNDSSYVRTTEKRLLQEYMKAVNLLTINEENRLKIKVELLESETEKLGEIATLRDRLDEMQARIEHLTDRESKLVDELYKDYKNRQSK
jgi:integrase